ncbi:MAG TPA: PspC domain-containing protein [Allosphingosinicella sp.]|nr:PspC domain-containing protein [Allosphingosinicella sp.]
MSMRGKSFEVDRANGKIAGVCAGIANMTGVDVTMVRVAVVVVTILGAFPWTLIAYAIAAYAGQPRRRAAYTPIAGRDESRERMRNMDLRMQAIETYVTSSNSKLAREIEELR